MNVLKSSTYPYYTSTYKDLYLLNNPYSFHFNGQEADDEIAGVDNIMSAEFWEYDTRLARRWNRDPIVYPYLSAYSVLRNCPIYFIDHNGLEPRMNIFKRGWNWVKGDGWKNKLNKISSDIDESKGVNSRIHYAKTNDGRDYGYVEWNTESSDGNGKDILNTKNVHADRRTIYDNNVISTTFKKIDRFMKAEGGYNKYDWAYNSPIKSMGIGYEFAPISYQIAGGLVKFEFKNQAEQLSNSESGLGTFYTRGIGTISHTIMGGNSELLKTEFSKSNYFYFMFDFNKRAGLSMSNNKYEQEVVNIIQVCAFKMEWNETTMQLKIGAEVGKGITRMELSRNLEHNIQKYEYSVK